MPCKAVFPTSMGAAKVQGPDARSPTRDSGQPSVAEPLSDRRGREIDRRRDDPSLWPITILLASEQRNLMSIANGFHGRFGRVALA